MRRRSYASTGQMCLFTATSWDSPEAPALGESSDATCSSAARPARTSALPVEAPACPPGRVPACGGSTSESSALSGHRSSLLRTLLVLAGGGSLRSRRRWPRSGTGGLTFASELATSGTITSATASSSLLPTLTVSARDNHGGGSGRVGPVRPSLQTMAREGLLPTLQARDCMSGDRKRAEAGGKVGSNGRRWGLNLRDVVLLPTLTSRDWKSSSPSTWKTNARPLSEHMGRLLCPTWCEQFMGFPAGWTELSASAIRSYRSRRRRRGAS